MSALIFIPILIHFYAILMKAVMLNENFSLYEFKEHFFKSKKFTYRYSNLWCSYKFMSQVEVFTELHAYPIFIAIFVHDCSSHEGCYAKQLNFYQY